MIMSPGPVGLPNEPMIQRIAVVHANGLVEFRVRGMFSLGIRSCGIAQG